MDPEPPQPKVIAPPNIQTTDELKQAIWQWAQLDVDIANANAELRDKRAHRTVLAPAILEYSDTHRLPLGVKTLDHGTIVKHVETSMDGFTQKFVHAGLSEFFCEEARAANQSDEQGLLRAKACIEHLLARRKASAKQVVSIRRVDSLCPTPT